MSLCTLDIICDTVMGQHVGAQEDATSPYVRAVVEVSTDTCPVKSAMFHVIRLLTSCTTESCRPGSGLTGYSPSTPRAAG